MQRVAITVVAFVIGTSACTPSTSAAITGTGIPTPQDMATRVLPSSTPSPTPGVMLTPATTSTPSPTRTPLPLSRVVALNRSWANSGSRTCGPDVLTGEIWLVGDGIDKATPILRRPGTGYYFPVWSPDGQWIAAVEVDEVSPVVEHQGDATRRTYAASDHLIVTRSDGADVRGVSEALARVEYSTLTAAGGENCMVLNYIQSILGWSDDGEWIAYEYSQISGAERSVTQYAANVDSGDVAPLSAVANVSWLFAGELSHKVIETLAELSGYSEEVPPFVVGASVRP